MTLHASRHSRVVLVAATFMLGATTLVAQPQGRVRFDDMDLNRDGVIARDEWRGSDRDFRAYDLNHDGVLSRNRALERETARRDQSAVVTPAASGSPARRARSRPAASAARKRAVRPDRTIAIGGTGIWTASRSSSRPTAVTGATSGRSRNSRPGTAKPS